MRAREFDPLVQANARFAIARKMLHPPFYSVPQREGRAVLLSLDGRG